MAYTPNTWQDRTGTGLNKFTDQNGNEYEFTPTPDEITQQGTPFSAAWMNHIEQGIKDNSDNFPVSIENGGTGAETAAEARAKLGVAGARINPVEDDFYTLTPPDGSFMTALRAPFGGLLPYHSGGSGTLGRDSDPWLLGFIDSLSCQTITFQTITGTKIYSPALAKTLLFQGTLTIGNSAVLTNATKYAWLMVGFYPGTSANRAVAVIPSWQQTNAIISSSQGYIIYTSAISGDNIMFTFNSGSSGGEVVEILGFTKYTA